MIIDTTFEEIKMSLWERIKYWWSMRKKQKCDRCDGTFRLGNLCPVSGDWWLCDKCFNEYMKEFTDSLGKELP
jgi:hypothetical protein